MAKDIVILGAGYGGVLTALTVREYMTKDVANVTLVNKYPTHQIITELHRLAAGNVSEQRLALPLEKLFKGQGVNIVIAEVESFDVENKRVKLSNGDTLGYDVLVVGLGSVTNFFGIPGLEENSLVLKSVDDAKKICQHVEERIQSYAQTKDPADATIVIGGGGLTGVELVGEFVDWMPDLTQKYGVDCKDVQIKLVEGMPKILPVLPDPLIEYATESLERRGVEFITGVFITGVDGNVIELKDGTQITANTFVWTGGIAGNPLVGESGLEVNRGRASVNEYLQSTSHPDVFVVGDSAVAMNPEGKPYPPTAQNSWQMGETAGYNVYAYLTGGALKPFDPVDLGTLASLGRKDCVAAVGANRTHLKGTPAAVLKEASNVRYLAHIKGLFSYAY